jgi:hypothetical protein
MGAFSLRISAALLGAALLILPAPASAQSVDPKASEQSRQQAGDAKEAQKQVDHLTDAAKQIQGPGGNPECVWVGERMVRLLYNDDLDTAFRHLDLYDRFGCPGGHIQAAFRCLVRQNPELKSNETLTSRVQACWINPGAQPSTAAANPGQPATTNR